MPAPFPQANVWQRLARDVFEAFLGTAFALSGLSGTLAPGTRTTSIVRTLPGWAQGLWYSCLLVGGVLALAGILRGGRVGLELRRVGLLTLAGLTASYAVASASLVGWRGLTGSLLLLTLAVACVVQAVKLSRDIAVVQAVTRPLP